MNVLIVGGGGREHALAWKIRQSPLVEKLWCAPGNAGTARIAQTASARADDNGALLEFAESEEIALTVVGPELPLTEGIVDLFRAAGRPIFGPTKDAARLEGSKVYAKAFMRKYGIPTAEFRTFTAAERYDAERFINELPAPLVVKADGLAAGKGVTVCESKEEALAALSALMDERRLGPAGASVVIEEFLSGEEASIFAVTDGREYVLLPPAQDHKRILDDDLGKNTGGMGAYAPAPAVTPEVLAEVRRAIIEPTLDGMAREGAPYTGCLYAGIMLTPTGPKVIEYNCRFGDPEAQVVLPLVEGDIVPLLAESAEGAIRRAPSFLTASAVCVVVAAGGYPGAYEKGKPILGLRDAERPGVVVFHAGTAEAHGSVVTAGGRVLGVTAVGEGLEETIRLAYKAVEKITFDGMYYRSDIGKKGLMRLQQRPEMQ